MIHLDFNATLYPKIIYFFNVSWKEKFIINIIIIIIISISKWEKITFSLLKSVPTARGGWSMEGIYICKFCGT